jgi:hypothetical protein
LPMVYQKFDEKQDRMLKPIIHVESVVR